MNTSFDTERECENCMHYLPIGKIDLCLKHKIQIVPVIGLGCVYWEDDLRDNLHDDNAAQQCEQSAIEEIHSRS